MKALYEGTLKPLLCGFGDYDKRDVQNFALEQLFFNPLEFLVDTFNGIPFVQQMDNKRIQDLPEAQDLKPSREPVSITNERIPGYFGMTRSELLQEAYRISEQDLRLKPSLQSEARSYSNGDLSHGVRRRDQTGVDFMTNLPRYYNSGLSANRLTLKDMELAAKARNVTWLQFADGLKDPQLKRMAALVR